MGDSELTIPKRFIRVWLGPRKIPDMFQQWWLEFGALHPKWEFVTLKDDHTITIPDNLESAYRNADSYAGRSDVLRLLALKEMGGVYMDADFMPLKSFDPLLSDPRPFVGMRSSRSFANGAMGFPANHSSLDDVLEALPSWFVKHKNRSSSVQTGPAFLSSVLFGRKDIRHMPLVAFYPYNGFGAPKREDRLEMFARNEFPSAMFAAHFGDHRWGGRP